MASKSFEFKGDRITFQFADPKNTHASSVALATVAHTFVQEYKDLPPSLYHTILNTVVDTLTKSDEMTPAILKALETSLNERQNAIIEEGRGKTSNKKDKFAHIKPGYNPLEEDSEEELNNMDAEARLAAQEEEARRLEQFGIMQEKLAEQQRKDEEAREQLRIENERKIAERARQVDAAAIEEKLKREGAVLLNEGSWSKGKPGKPGKGGKGGKGNQPTLSPEECQELAANVATITKEKDRLKEVLTLSPEELPAYVEQAKKELTEAETKAKGLSSSPSAPPRTLDKGQIAQLQQKLTKQTTERDRLALQLKAIETSVQPLVTAEGEEKEEILATEEGAEMEVNRKALVIRKEILEILEKRDAFRIIIEKAEAP